ncbi:MAG TPA: hypothetical protein VNK04_23485 [Gemmataceae bacterium]|nr:hypothetical protein [Gemmataceae bacterium]
MATAPPRPRRNLDESHRRVRHPLQRLRGYIRFYVGIEGVATLLIFVALWFWIGLLLDYESFNLFHLDWVQEVPAYGRALVLGGLFVAMALVGVAISQGVASSRKPGLLPEAAPAQPARPLVAAALGTADSAGSAKKERSWPDLIGWALVVAGLLLLLTVKVAARTWLQGWPGVAIFLLLALACVLAFAGLTAVAAATLYRLVRSRGWGRTLLALPLVPLYLAAWVGVGALAGAGLAGPWLTLLLVLLLLLGPVLAVVLTRLFHDFRDQALALVLERRYPRELGDRLITAVELADPQQGARYGYSPAMIEQTIHDAADRVEALPVEQVFDWKRLRHLGLVVGLLTLGIYLPLWVGHALSAPAQGNPSGFERFADILAIGVERNVLLQNSLWPRQAHLELVDFPGDEIRIPQNTQPPPILVRAYKWVIADKASPHGWRPVRWDDLKDLLGEVPPGVPQDWRPQDAERGPTVDEVEMLWAQFPVRRNPEGPPHWVVVDEQAEGGRRPLTWAELSAERLGGVGVPALPGGWLPADPRVGLTLDDVQAQLARAEHAAPGRPVLDEQQRRDLRFVMTRLERLAALGETLDRLQELAAQPRMSRTLRLLTIPEQVAAHYRGADTRGDVSAGREPGNLYAVRFPVLKESVRFHVRGADFYTPARRIVTVPPPTLTALVRDEYRPAYLYYRLPRNVGPEALRGRKQLFRNLTVSRFGSEASRFDVPAGTEVILTARTDKPLRQVEIRPREGSLRFQARPEMVYDDQGRCDTFRVRFANVRPTPDRPPGRPAVLDFELVFTDTDNVTSSRNVVIKPVEDAPPVADLEVTVLRKTPQGYMITPRAYIPFSGKISDDRGLSQIDYAYTLAPLEKDVEQGGRSLLMLGAVGLIVGGPPHEVLVAAAMAALAREPKADEAGKDVRRLPLASFDTQLDERPRDLLPLPEIYRRLGESREQTARRLRDEGVSADLQEIIKRLGEQPPWRELLKAYELKPEAGGTPFDLLELPKRGDNRLRVADTAGGQQRYRLTVWMEALDNDLETGPNRGRSKDTFSFVVVSEEELRLEIFKDEEDLRYKMQEVFNRLRGPGSCEYKMGQVISDLARPDLKLDGIGFLIARADELKGIADKCVDETAKVHLRYSAIQKELEANRVQQSKITQVADKIVKPLEEVLKVEFPRAITALEDLSKRMTAAQEEFAKKPDLPPAEIERLLAQSRKDAADTRQRLQELADKIQLILNEMEQIISFDEVLKRAIKILDGVVSQEVAFKRWEDWLKKKLLEDLLEPSGPAKKP